MDEKYVVCPSIVETLKKMEKLESSISYLERLDRRLAKLESKVRNIQTVPVSIEDKEALEKPVRSIVEEVIEEMKRMGDLQ